MSHLVPATKIDSAKPRAAYIHVPFCAHRCGYCDFTLVTGRDDLVGDYLKCLRLEIERAEVPQSTPLDSLFFGGGTPTHPKPDELRRLFEIVLPRFQITSGTEVSLEANPLDLSPEKIDLLADAGVNRISLGVQSFSPNALKLLERNHTPDDIADVFSRLRTRFTNISLDLIFGIPGQSLGDWKRTLDCAIDLDPTHVSTYGLTFEQGTTFWTRRERGEIRSADEELERDQYALAMEQLSAAGFEQYEISNYARPGYQCRHNHTYWNGDPYWAFGPGAARYLNGQRETNIRSVLGWLNRIEQGESPVTDSEKLDTTHRARELIYLGLRRNTGIQRQAFRARTDIELDNLVGPTIREQTKLGLLADDGLRISFTTEGRFVADRVVMEFL